MIREIIETLNESSIKFNSRGINSLMSELGAKLIGQTKKGGKWSGYTPEVYGNVISVYEIGKLIIVLEKSSNDFYLTIFTEKPKPEMLTSMWNYDSQTPEGTKIIKYMEKITGMKISRKSDFDVEKIKDFIEKNK
jgi:hypothetical protein